MAKLPWYADGLAFSCTQCGRCCRGPGGYVWITDDEAQRAARAAGMAFDAFAKKYLRQTREGLAFVDGPGGDCVFYDRDTAGCRIYGERPEQCRSWPWWPELLSSRDAWQREANRCPGMDRGAVWPRERIENAIHRK